VVVATDGSGNPTMPILVDPTNDANPVVITFKAIDNAGKESTLPGTATLNFTPVFTLSGNILNDANGLTDNTVNGTGVNGPAVPQLESSPVPVFVSLVQNGTVIATVPVNSTGGYSFTGVSPNSYSVVLTTNPAGSVTPSVPLSWTNTGENLGTGTGNDGNPNGVLSVTVTASPVTNANIGIEQLPLAGSGFNTVTNAGGTSPVTVPTTTFTNTGTISDVAPGTVTSIRIPTFPTNTTSLTINGTVYTPASTEFTSGTGVVVATDGSGHPTVPILVDPTNDANPVSIPYKAIDNAGMESTNTGTAVINSTPVFNIAGNVFNDPNGLTDNTVNGTAVDGTSVPQAGGSPVPAFVSLVSNGTIVATVPVTAAGSYTFTGVAPGSYSVVLTTNPAGSTTPGTPTSWTNTGENLGTSTGNDGTPNGILPVTVSGASVPDANFGIEQLPTAGSGSNTVANSGGTTPVTVPTTTFTNGTPTSDVAPGTVTSIRITTFPSNVTSLTINGTVYTPASTEFTSGTGVVVATDGNGNPTVPILVDPTNDANLVSIPFKAIDNAGKESTNTGTAVISSTPAFTLSGNVLDDGNGLTDNTVNTFGPGALSPVNGTSLGGVPLYATLVSSGTIVATVAVTSTGSYTFVGVPAGTYSVVLSTSAAGSLTSSLPASWTSTGENVGAGSGSDGTANGILTGITVTATNVTNANFGIDKQPVGTSVTLASQPNPGGTTQVPVSATAFTGTDTEDGTYPNNLTGRTVTLTPATNGTLYYNGTPVNSTTAITGFDPTKVTLDPTATGATAGNDPTFTYSVTDNAGVPSSPSTITVPFTAGVPDLAPIIYALPATQYGTTNFTVVVDVYDLLTTASNGLITVYISKDPLVNLSFNGASVLVGGRPVQNSIWTFDGTTDPDSYIFTTTQVIAGRGHKSIGLTGVLTPGNTQGTLTISTTIVGGSGGEVRTNNNSDADKIDYFKK
jgi:hypothetical protein